MNIQCSLRSSDTRSKYLVIRIYGYYYCKLGYCYCRFVLTVILMIMQIVLVSYNTFIPFLFVVCVLVFNKVDNYFNLKFLTKQY